jgi:hypothetical protein
VIDRGISHDGHELNKRGGYHLPKAIRKIVDGELWMSRKLIGLLPELERISYGVENRNGKVAVFETLDTVRT